MNLKDLTVLSSDEPQGELTRETTGDTLELSRVVLTTSVAGGCERHPTCPNDQIRRSPVHSIVHPRAAIQDLGILDRSSMGR